MTELASSELPLILAANARMPSARAQSVQLCRAAQAFQGAGADTVVLHAARRDTPRSRPEDVWAQLTTLPTASTSEGAAIPPRRGWPGLMAAGCVDWIDLVPRPLQFLPARLQEWSFGRSAARIIQSRFQGARVLARDLEIAVHLRGRPGVALELHRVPGGRTRRRWLRRCVGAGMPVVAISGGVRDDLEALGVPADRITVEHDAHDPALVDALPERAAAREALGLDPDAGVVLYAGGLLRWKGADVLVDAARGDLLGKATVLIVGGMDADVTALRQRASGLSNVRVLGHRAAHEIPLFLAAADVGVVPNRRKPRISSHYTSPLKVFEAMAAELPLVVSDLPSLRDVLRPDEAVFVEPESPEALGRGIAGLLADADHRRAMAARARESVQANTWGARARRILTFMEQHA